MEDDADGSLGETRDECYQRDTGVVRDILKPKVLGAGRGGRSFLAPYTRSSADPSQERPI